MAVYAVGDTLAGIRPAALWVEAQATAAGIDAALCTDIQICIEEVLANLVLHGVARDGDAGKRIALRLGIEPGAAVVEIEDGCEPFDPTDADRPLPEGDDPFRIGGNGLVLLRRFASTLTYAPGAASNRLTLRFARPDGAPDRDDAVRLIGSIPIFANAPEAVLHELVDGGERQIFEAGTVLLQQGSLNDFVLIILSGDVAISTDSGFGSVDLAIRAAPILIGEIGALSGIARTASVRAETIVQALRIDGAAFQRIACAIPEILISAVRHLGQQMRSVNNTLALYATGVSALESDDFDPGLLDGLESPSETMASFASAFRSLARRVTLERRNRADMASAAVIQSAMLPLPLDPAWQAGRCSVHAAMRPAREIGGDFYDIVPLDDHRIAVIVGDICGKGVPASLFMAVTVTALRMAINHIQDPARLVEAVNNSLCARNAANMFASLACCVIDTATGVFDFVNCGHNAPLVIRRNGTSEVLQGGGLSLGLFDRQQWTSSRHRLQPGETLLLFTDGVTECLDTAEQEYGDDRLARIVTSQPFGNAADLVDAVFADLDRYSAGAAPFDDITCLAVRRH